jgi:xanthine dehydrogenase accessory factor
MVWKSYQAGAENAPEHRRPGRSKSEQQEIIIIMKVLIKGAGDLASGIGCRLHRCGFEVVMTDIAVPTTVRRTVAFSRAVYEGEARVEDITGVLCRSLEEIHGAMARDQIAVIVDEECSILEAWKPDVVVDAIIAKKNLGTRITDGEVVVGVGPGFTAGIDCHVVVETKRGHNLGRCIWEGSAFPNTGVPGMIGGYDKERIIRAAADGTFKGQVMIGELVEKGRLVGYSGGVPIYAEVGGVVRGLLQDGVVVTKGMKSGDIDPRGNVENCRTVSDKAASIGGGVLEAILSMKKKKGGI